MDDELSRIREKRMAEIQEKAARAQSADGSVITISEYRIAEILQAHPALVIDFWAEWCGPCRRVAPVIEDLAREFAGQVTFGKCNTDENQQLARELSISAIPSIMFFSHGRMVDRIVGAYPREAIRDKVVRSFNIQS